MAKKISSILLQTLAARYIFASSAWRISILLLGLAITSGAFHGQGIVPGATASGMDPGSRSSIKVYDLKTGAIRVLFAGDGFYEAPWWSHDGKYIYFEGGPNQKLYRVPASGGEPQVIDLGDVRIKHDQGFSPDGKWHAMNLAGGTQLFLSTASGANRHAITPPGQLFYFHVWSPDSRWITGVSRSPDTSYGIYRVKIDGTEEQQLSHSGDAISDEPDYSSDGKWIYFNSDRSGSWDIWRMPADGDGAAGKLAEQVTSDPLQDWFPHPSPDGKWLLLLSFSPEVGIKIRLPEWLKEHPGETISHFNLSNHPYNQQATLRIQPLPGDRIKPQTLRTLTHLIGGQGSLNINSWSPDSTRFAFASYESEVKK